MDLTKTLKTIGKILSPLKKSIIPLILIVAFLLIDVYCNLTLPKYTADIVDIGIQNTDFNYIISVGTMMMAMVLVGVLATIGLSYFSSKVSAAYGRDLRKISYDKILKFSNFELNKISRASLITRNTNDVYQIQIFLGLFFTTILFSPILGIGSILKAMELGTNLLWIIAVTFAAAIIPFVIIFIRTVPYFKVMQELTDKINQTSREILMGIPVIKAFVRQDYEEERFRKTNEDFRTVNLNVFRILLVLLPAMTLLLNLMIVLILYFGAYDAIQGEILTGTIIAFIQYATQIVMAFLMMGGFLVMIPRILVSGKRVAEVINTEITISDGPIDAIDDNPIIERNRLIIQASIHYLIEQDMNIFNPFLSIFNPEDYNNRDVNHLINMVKAKTFFEYSQRRQIQINEDLAITIGSYDDFNYANNIWAKDVEGIKYKLSDKQKLVLKVMEDNGYIMTDDNALTHVEKLSEEYYNTQSRKARDKLLEDKCTKKKLSDLTGIKENTLTNVLDRIEGTSKSLVEHKLIGRYKLNEDDKFSKVIYYKRVIDGESLKSENDSMLTLYFQNTKEKNPSFVLKKIIIDLLYYVKILINERGYIYLKNYCDNHHGDIDVESYDSIVDFMEGFFNGLDHDECTINVEDSSFYDIEQMSNFKGEIDNEFDEKIEIYISSSDEEFLTKEGKMEENAPINDCGKNFLCISEMQSEHKNDLAIEGISKEIDVDFTLAHEIFNVLSSGEKNLNEIINAISEGKNPDDVVMDTLPLKVEMSLKRLVENDYLNVIEPINQATKYQITQKLKSIFEGDDV